MTRHLDGDPAQAAEAWLKAKLDELVHLLSSCDMGAVAAHLLRGLIVQDLADQRAVQEEQDRQEEERVFKSAQFTYDEESRTMRMTWERYYS
jgi:hypothetical protein